MGRYDKLIEEIAARKPKTILEVGTHMGNSAVRMVAKAQEFNDQIFYYGFDLFEFMTDDYKEYEFHGKSHCDFSTPSRRLKKTGCKYKLKAGNTRKTLKKFSPDRQIDFIYIDGGHSIDTIQSDWDNVKRFMDEKTVVIFDDYYENREDVGCKKIINGIGPEYKVTLMEPVDYIEKNDLYIRYAKVTK